MGFFLTDAVSSLFARPGQNAANDQSSRNSQVGRSGMDVFNLLQPGMMNQAKWISGMEPQREQTYSNLINWLTRSMNSNDSGAFAAHSGQEAQDQGMQTYRNMTGGNPGITPSMREGLLLNANNQRAGAYNSAYQQANDPAAIAQKKQALMQVLGMAYGQAGSGPGFDMYSKLASLIYGQPQVQVGAGLGDSLGAVLGGWAQGGFKH